MVRDLKNVPRTLLMFANVAAATAASLFFVAVFLSPATFSQGGPDAVAELVTDVRSRAGWQLGAMLGLALLLCNLLYLLYGRRPSHPARHVLGTTPDGDVRVQCDVIEQALRAAGEATEDVSRVRIVVESLPKRILVRTQFQAPDGTSIQSVSQALKRVLARRFDELVRPTGGRPVEFEIEFTGFLGKPVRRDPAPEPPAEPEPERPFTGPQYPVDAEDPEGHDGRGGA